jgi:hypothetical protein
VGAECSGISSGTSNNRETEALIARGMGIWVSLTEITGWPAGEQVFEQALQLHGIWMSGWAGGRTCPAGVHLELMRTREGAGGAEETAKGECRYIPGSGRLPLCSSGAAKCWPAR